MKLYCIYSSRDFLIETAILQTTFDSTLLAAWKCAEKDKVLNYKIKECEIISKIITVNNCEFTVTLNEQRFSNRRTPQHMTSLNQAFDHSRFNFTKVKNNEILMTIGINSEINKSDNVIIVNASPFQEGHVLLVPELSSCHNQVMREQPLRTALDTILISGEQNFTVSFNSMLACASVNHMHFYLFVSPQPLLSSLLDIVPLIDVDCQLKVFHMSNHPVHNVVVTFSNIGDLNRDFKLFWSVVVTFQELAIPHTICFVRSKEGIRGIIWPRRVEQDHSIKLGNGPCHNIINVALSELAGQIYTGDKQLFNNNLDSELLERSFRRVNLTDECWREIVQSMKNKLINQ